MVFQLSYVGDSSEAKGFIHDISVDPEVKDMVYCNLKSLDEQLANKSSGMKNEYVSIFFSFREWGGGRLEVILTKWEVLVAGVAEYGHQQVDGDLKP